MNYKEIKKLKKSELQELLATTLQQKATQERVIASLQYTEENILIDELYSNIDERDAEIDELSDKIDRLETENKIHLREKQEARELAKKYSLSNNELRNESEARRIVILETRDLNRQLKEELSEGSTPKNLYIHEIDTIFADSGELHLLDGEKSLVFNCSNLVQDLATINDMVIKSAKRELKDSIQQIKQLAKDM